MKDQLQIKQEWNTNDILVKLTAQALYAQVDRQRKRNDTSQQQTVMMS